MGGRGQDRLTSRSLNKTPSQSYVVSKVVDLKITSKRRSRGFNIAECEEVKGVPYFWCRDFYGHSDV